MAPETVLLLIVLYLAPPVGLLYGRIIEESSKRKK